MQSVHVQAVSVRLYDQLWNLKITALKVSQATHAASADRRYLVNGDEQVLGARRHKEPKKKFKNINCVQECKRI